jgi:hypothetical protein
MLLKHSGPAELPPLRNDAQVALAFTRSFRQSEVDVLWPRATTRRDKNNITRAPWVSEMVTT